MRRNPRKVTWTVFYRRKHKKGIEEEAAKKRTRRTHKFQRAIVGASLSEIQAKRNMKPEVSPKSQLLIPICFMEIIIIFTKSLICFHLVLIGT